MPETKSSALAFRDHGPRDPGFRLVEAARRHHRFATLMVLYLESAAQLGKNTPSPARDDLMRFGASARRA